MIARLQSIPFDWAQDRGVEFAAPVDRIDLEAEWILPQHIGRSWRLHLYGQHRGPARGAGKAAAFIRPLGPFDLEAGVGRADHAGHLHRHGAPPEIRTSTRLNSSH